MFAFGFGAGYSFRAVISAMHRRRSQRNRGYPLAE
jgi:hypothetical protein